MKRKHSLLLFIPLVVFEVYFLSTLKGPATRTSADETWQFVGLFITLALGLLNLGNLLSIRIYAKNMKQTDPELYDRVMENFGDIIWDELK